MLCLVAGFVLFAQLSAAANLPWAPLGREEMVKVLERVNKWFTGTASYSVTVTHASYESYVATVSAEKSVGYFRKNQSDYHSFLIGIHTIQNSRYKIVVDSAQQLIMVANPDKSSWTGFGLEDYNYALQYCTAVLYAPSGKDKHYRLEFGEEFALSAYEFALDEQGLMKEIVLYYNETGEDEEGKPIKARPRLSISFSNYAIGTASGDKKEFDESSYFTVRDKKLVLNEKYKNYKLSDQRYKK